MSWKSGWNKPLPLGASEMAHGATTGTCAAAAAKAAALHARGVSVSRTLEVPLPGGERAEVELLAWGGSRAHPWASVRKPVTEDPDATRAAVVVACLSPADQTSFRAGTGVGTVTRPGLQLAIGEPAINPHPRRQIELALAEVGDKSWQVTISVLGGGAIAAKTFNPRLGIVGGISILGTSGTVRPWSTEAFLASVDAHLGVVRAKGQNIALLVPGHMGERAAARMWPGLECVEVGNSWGAALDLVGKHGFREVLAVGHSGKLVKIAQGQWDTHSSVGSSAADWAWRILRHALPARMPTIDTTVGRPETLEGLFGSLDPQQSLMASTLLAGRVARRISRRTALPSRVHFIDLTGKFVGEGSS
jgi:cobalt-precorrin-5B (C1)-methyltransferase